MSRAPNSSRRTVTKDMYWFAHGGIETAPDHPHSRHINATGDTEDESSENSSLSWRSNNLKEVAASHTEGYESSASQKEKEDRIPSNLPSVATRLSPNEKRLAVEEKKKQMLEADHMKNEAILRKSIEREAALEARRNATRSNISFAFGSSVPRNLEPETTSVQQNSEVKKRPTSMYGLSQKPEDSVKYLLHSSDASNYETCTYTSSFISDGNLGQDCSVNRISPTTFSHIVNHGYEAKSRVPANWLSGSGALIAENVMSQSMICPAVSRGRRKNDLTPTVPYDRTGPSRPVTCTGSRKRSVSMSRLDQLAQPRKHYVEAQKANSAINNTHGKQKDRSPTRPVSSASEKSVGSGRISSTPITRRSRGPPKPRPVSIAGTVPDNKSRLEAKASTIMNRSFTKKAASTTDNSPKSAASERIAKKYEPKPLAEKQSVPKSSSPKLSKKPAPKVAVASKPSVPKSTANAKQSSPKVSPARKLLTNKKQAAILVATPSANDDSGIDESRNMSVSPVRSPTPDSESQTSDEKTSTKRIISEEEAKAALAEKRRLAREQAEREAELERQRQEEIKRQEEERLRHEEEEQRRLEEEQLRLLEEHRRNEEEKLKKAIEEQQKREEEEKAKREEEARLKVEQERKAKEEAEKQRQELEEKLKREEEERAERKKRLEKIMSRTRGKPGVSSPSGSTSGSDQPDSLESQQNSSSGPHSLDDNASHEQHQVDDAIVEAHSNSESFGAQETLTLPAETGSLSSNDLMLPASDNTSLDGSLQVIPSEHNSLDSNQMIDPVNDNALISEAPVSEELALTKCDSVESIERTSNVEHVTNILQQDLVIEASLKQETSENEKLNDDIKLNSDIENQSSEKNFIPENSNNAEESFVGDSEQLPSVLDNAFAASSQIDQPVLSSIELKQNQIFDNGDHKEDIPQIESVIDENNFFENQLENSSYEHALPMEHPSSYLDPVTSFTDNLEKDQNVESNEITFTTEALEKDKSVFVENGNTSSKTDTDESVVFEENPFLVKNDKENPEVFKEIENHVFSNEEQLHSPFEIGVTNSNSIHDVSSDFSVDKKQELTSSIDFDSKEHLSQEFVIREEGNFQAEVAEVSDISPAANFDGTTYIENKQSESINLKLNQELESAQERTILYPDNEKINELNAAIPESSTEISPQDNSQFGFPIEIHKSDEMLNDKSVEQDKDITVIEEVTHAVQFDTQHQSDGKVDHVSSNPFMDYDYIVQEGKEASGSAITAQDEIVTEMSFAGHEVIEHVNEIMSETFEDNKHNVPIYNESETTAVLDTKTSLQSTNFNQESEILNVEQPKSEVSSTQDFTVKDHITDSLAFEQNYEVNTVVANLVLSDDQLKPMLESSFNETYSESQQKFSDKSEHFTHDENLGDNSNLSSSLMNAYTENDPHFYGAGIPSEVQNEILAGNNISDAHILNNLKFSHDFENTESENSSLDSNLSQVLTVHNTEDSTFTENSQIQKEVYSNGHSPVPGEILHTNQFEPEYDSNVHPFYNGENIPKSNGYHDSLNDVVMSGDRFESVNFKIDQTSTLTHDMMQQESNGIGTNNISSVDFGNIIENVDNSLFSKAASNPFLGSGGPSQMTVNPFLQQENTSSTSTELLN